MTDRDTSQKAVERHDEPAEPGTLPIPTPRQCVEDLSDDGYHPQATCVERLIREASYHRQELDGMVTRLRRAQARAEAAEAERDAANEDVRVLLREIYSRDAYMSPALKAIHNRLAAAMLRACKAGDAALLRECAGREVCWCGETSPEAQADCPLKGCGLEPAPDQGEWEANGSTKWGPQFPPSCCTAWEDCVHDGVCHDANCNAPSQHGDDDND